MGSFGGFYKGDKKKAKKDKQPNAAGTTSGGFGAPVLTMPEIISKKKKDY